MNNKNTKTALTLLAFAVIFFLFGSFAVFLIVVAVIGYICYMAKKNGTGKDIFKNRDLLRYESGNKLVDNIVTTIRDNTRDVKVTAKPNFRRAGHQQYNVVQYQFEISSFNTPFEPKRGNHDPGNLVDMLEREKERNGLQIQTL